ncbi:MAG: bi-domain-containing oxidoreductase [Blastocatellia bacterium]|nr:bi-domain-containing oxidoreductase [Blastocatellia bacterium]
MKQVIQNFRTGELKVDEVPETICRSGGILIDNVASLISAGTEKMVIDLAQKSLAGKARERPDLVRQVISKFRRDGFISTVQTVRARLEAPIALGYSCAGSVREVGRGAEEFIVGERVACAGMNHASHAETVFVPKNLAVRIPENLSFAEAAFVTLGAIALQGVRTAEAKLGDSVAVIGLGLLGQLTLQILKAAGCRTVGVDLDPSRVELARSLGAEAAVLRDDDVEGAVAQFTGGYGVDAVIMTAAAETSDPIELAGSLARDRAVVSVVGAAPLDLPRKLYYEKELQLRLSRSYGPGRYDEQYEERGIDYPIGYVRWTERRNMEEFLRLVSLKAVNLDPLVTHRFPIAQAEQAYRLISGKNSAEEAYLGILLEYAEKRTPSECEKVIALNTRRGEAGIKLGLIGAGNFARGTLLPLLLKAEGVSLIGIATATGRNAKAYGEKYGFRYCTTRYRELLESDKIDTVIIATRHNTHASMSAEAVRAGKTVYLEKPLALSEEDLSEVVCAVAQANGRLMVGFNRRFSTFSSELKRFFYGIWPLAITYRINAGAIAKESWIQGEAGGGRIQGEVCHFVDYLQFLADSDPVEVFAYQSADGMDTLSIVIKMSDGSVGNINYFATGDRAFPKERIEIYGGNRLAVLDDFRTLEMWKRGKRKTVKRMVQDKGFEREVASFLQAARTGAELPIPWRSQVLTTLTTLRIVDALGSGRPEKVDLKVEI